MSKRMARNDRARTRKMILRLVILILVLGLTGSLVYLGGRNLMFAYHKHQRDTVLAQYGTIEQKLQGEGWVIRRETVFQAPAIGFFENMVSDGSKVSINTLLGYYLNRDEKIALRASMSGLFTRQIDGLEEVLGDINLSAAGPETFSYRTQQHDPEAEFKPGQGLYKIVDNLEPTRLLLQFPPPKDDPKLAQGQPASLRVNGRGLGKCTVIDFKNDFDKLVVMVETPDFREDLLNTRKADAELTMKSPYGYLVPEKSLLNNGKEKGIYCIDGEEICFKPVQVLAVRYGIAVVDGLQPNDMVIVKTGQRTQ